ncbi:hypothetical protein [Telmatospirillum siberiense]|uniref:Uncharacterized protein n=1 Tax=Telmatospirillum siberiense TaxID=382514 RepID=A0A2N3PU24_9PROT|nr:hypothetical protein [Telmatospirillum siberiense]PKU23898.1 hypothetical protein CWS72_14580 [Telmatospirillum siberiense]
MSDTKLTYSLQPSNVFVALQTDLTLTITNPSQTTPVTLQPGMRADEILVTFPMPPGSPPANALIDSAGFSAENPEGLLLVGPQTTGSNVYVIRPADQQVTLQPGHAITVVFSQLAINATVGATTVGIDEYIGSGAGRTSLGVSKVPQELKVIGWLTDYTVGLGQYSLLRWQSFGGTKVTLYGLPGIGYKEFKVSGDPPYPGKYAVSLLKNAQNTFTLVVETNDGRHEQTAVTLSPGAPYISYFKTTEQQPSPLPVNKSVDLVWSMLYAANAYLTGPQGQPRPVPTEPLEPRTITPGADAVAAAQGNLSAIPAQTVYELQGQGFEPPASARRIFQLGPVGLLYFKYLTKAKDGTLSDPAFDTDPHGWGGIQASYTVEMNTLHLFQPGGAETAYYLNSGETSKPQIRYFAADAPKDGKVALNWITRNLTNLTIDPGGYKIPDDKKDEGSMAVDPGPTAFILTGTRSEGGILSSTLVMTDTKGGAED